MVRPNSYVCLLIWWSKVEVPCRCFAELSPCFDYVGSWLIEYHHSGYWYLVAAEWEARVVLHLLWDVYDHLRIWYIPPLLRTIIRRLDLHPALGSEANVADLNLNLTIIDRVWWAQVHLANQPERDDSVSG